MTITMVIFTMVMLKCNNNLKKKQQAKLRKSDNETKFIHSTIHLVIIYENFTFPSPFIYLDVYEIFFVHLKF